MGSRRGPENSGAISRNFIPRTSFGEFRSIAAPLGITVRPLAREGRPYTIGEDPKNPIHRGEVPKGKTYVEFTSPKGSKRALSKLWDAVAAKSVADENEKKKIENQAPIVTFQ